MPHPDELKRPQGGPVSEFESGLLAAWDQTMAHLGPKRVTNVHCECPSGAPGALEWSRVVPNTHPWLIQRFQRENSNGDFGGVLSTHLLDVGGRFLR